VRKALIATVAGCALLLGAAGVAAADRAGGVTGPAFYVDGQLYRTVNTPTDLSNTGAPASSFDTIYRFFGVQSFNVATAAPGDAGYNGGRWRVHGLQFTDYARLWRRSTPTTAVTLTAMRKWRRRWPPARPPTSAWSRASSAP